MSDERWPRVKAVFQATVERPKEERDAFLAAVTGDDEPLRREVESLLASDADVSFLDQLPVASESVLADPRAVTPASMDHTLCHTVLTSGLRVGPYEIIAPLGAGAMGEVYRACDTKLNREVALKVLPEVFARDPDRLARFKREAQLLATLNHSNIAAIYGLEESNGAQALVLELVDGSTLADRIARGPISLKESLTIARQIAEALEAAHEKGIIHRDLKPANIKIARSGVVKVLDFGLAKIWDGAPQSDLSASPRLTATDILGRTILGTPAYMSPEQARGQSLDRRTDIWSFGCVLYEMLTGRAPFAGDTISDTLAAILEREPDRTMLPADTPVPIRRLLRRCLEKDRKGRLDSAAGARLEIDDAIASPAAETLALAAAPSRRVTPLAIAVLAGVAVIAALIVSTLMRPAPVAAVPPARFAIVPPPEPPLNLSGPDRDLAFSPDGRRLVYRAGGSETYGSPLMVRAIDQLDAQPVADVLAAYAPFFSPDSRWIGFFERTVLKKVSITGGPAITLCQVSGVPLGASWGDDNTIAFATDSPRTGLWRVSADGGEPTVLTTPDPAQHEGNHAFPSVLPRGRGVLFTITIATAGQADSSQVAVLDLTTGQRKILIRGGGDAQYVGTGHLIFAAAGALRTVRFDPVRLEVLSDPVTVVEDVMMKPSGAANYAVSGPGTLVYMPGAVGGQTALRSLVWVDRKGHEERIKAPLRGYGPPRISPDGTRVAIGILDQGNSEIWIWDLAREMLRRLTFAPGMDGLPVWTPDSRRIIFMSDRTGVLNLYSQAADGTGTVERLTTSANPQWPTSITPDGTRVFGFDNEPKRASSVTGRTGGVILVPLTSPANRFALDKAQASRRPGVGPSPGVSSTSAGPVVQNLFHGVLAEISPDGRYLAYQSDEAGGYEVYVRPFPQVDRGRWQISTGGATRPVWARSGRELFYLDASSALIGVPVRTSGPTFSTGIPAKIFDTKYVEPNPARHYDVSPDGQRFLMIKDSLVRDQHATPASMIIVLNWFEELKAKVPGGK
jgi:Tol biopolymer transport system component